jgi:hypothetical protein
MGFSPGEESLTAPLRLGDRGAAGLWLDQSQERRHGLACQTASGENSWRLVSGTGKVIDAGIEEREALAQKRKGCIGATKCTDALPPSHCWTRDGAASNQSRKRYEYGFKHAEIPRRGLPRSRWTAIARSSRWPGRKAATAQIRPARLRRLPAGRRWPCATTPCRPPALRRRMRESGSVC